MKSEISTLLFYTTNVPNRKRLVTDTLRLHLRLNLEKMPGFIRRNHLISRCFQEGYLHLSYVMDWYEAFVASPRIKVDACNINDVFQLAHYLRKISQYELVIILHSAAGDDLRTLLWSKAFFQNRKGKLIVCFGNEFTLMPDKIYFAKSVEPEFIVTQLPIASAQWLYSECTKSHVIAAPAALNPNLYHVRTDQIRVRDFGFRGSKYSFSIGDQERTELVLELKKRCISLGLSEDIQFKMMNRKDWTEFLSQSKGIPGAESTTYFLEKDDHTQKNVTAYLRENPQATFDDVYQRYFKDYKGSVFGKSISSRHFEPIGTHTCQLLLEGKYNGILEPEKHYIAVKKDLSDLVEAIKRWQDVAYRQSIVHQAYEYVMSRHTYGHRVNSILDAVGV